MRNTRSSRANSDARSSINARASFLASSNCASHRHAFKSQSPSLFFVSSRFVSFQTAPNPSRARRPIFTRARAHLSLARPRRRDFKRRRAFYIRARVSPPPRVHHRDAESPNACTNRFDGPHLFAHAGRLIALAPRPYARRRERTVGTVSSPHIRRLGSTIGGDFRRHRRPRASDRGETTSRGGAWAWDCLASHESSRMHTHIESRYPVRPWTPSRVSKQKKSSLGERGRGLWTLARNARTTVAHASRASDRHHPSCDAEDRDVGLDDRRQEGASVYLRHGHRVRVALRPATSACVRESNRIDCANCIASTARFEKNRGMTMALAERRGDFFD
jgi:hypothetical protein